MGSQITASLFFFFVGAVKSVVGKEDKEVTDVGGMPPKDSKPMPVLYQIITRRAAAAQAEPTAPMRHDIAAMTRGKRVGFDVGLVKRKEPTLVTPNNEIEQVYIEGCRRRGGLDWDAAAEGGGSAPGS